MKIAILGAGAWGTALAILAASRGNEVSLWARRVEQAESLLATRENRDYLPGVALPPAIRPTADPQEALWKAELAVVAIPSKGLRDTLAGLPKAPAYLSATKSLEHSEGGLLRMTQVIHEVTGVSRVAALSGPNHAEEVGRFLPAAAVAASADEGLARLVQQVFSGPSFRVYTSDDLIGVELGGALKNVIALAAGMSDGLRLGDNAKAALVTRGLREIVKFGVAQGAEAETFYGLSGLGDLVATATSPHSRNRGAGEKIVQGAALADLEASKQVVEGIYTVKALHAWGKQTGAEMPITESVYEVIYEGADPLQELSELMGREAKPE